MSVTITVSVIVPVESAAGASVVAAADVTAAVVEGVTIGPMGATESALAGTAAMARAAIAAVRKNILAFFFPLW